MAHVKEILANINRGEETQAHEEIQELLSLGPKNVQALKLQAALCAREGNFEVEAQIWQKVLDCDPEDENAIKYWYQRKNEWHEQQFFTENLPYGRRFFTFPRGLLQAASFGMAGCLLFLLLNRLGTLYFFFSVPMIQTGTFLLFVVGPWVGVLYHYLFVLRDVAVTEDGLELGTRLRTLFYPWGLFSQAYVIHPAKPQCRGLQLILVPHNENSRAVEIDLHPETSLLRTSKVFLLEVKKHLPADYVTDQRVNLPAKRLRF